MAPVTLAESLSVLNEVRDGLSTLNLDISRRAITARQDASGGQPIVVPATYQGINPGANGGEVAGIVLGVVFGVILVIWLINSLVWNPRLPPVIETSSVTDPGRYRRRTAGTRTATNKSSRRTTATARDRSRSRSVVSRSEMSERSPRVPSGSRRGGGRETIIVDEARTSSRPPRDEEEDIIEVIEEHSPVRRPRRMSGYRGVDPDEYGGGPRPMRKVRR